MGEVIEFPDSSEGNTYTREAGIIGSLNIATRAELIFHKGKAYIAIGSEILEFSSRKDAAEWFHQGAKLLDSEDRWLKSEYVGVNYDD